MENQETPITKYLASLDRRQSAMSDSPQTPQSNFGSIKQRINFDDDTFFMDGDKSLLHVPTPGSNKRKRTSLYDYLEKTPAENQNSDLERVLRKTQGELIDSRAYSSKLEHQINELKKVHGEKVIDLEKNIYLLKAKFRNTNDENESLKKNLEKLTKKEEENRENYKKQYELHNQQTAMLQDTISKLRTENFELKQQAEQENIKQSDAVRKLSMDLGETELGAEKWIMESQILKDQLALKDEQLKKYQEELKKAYSSERKEKESAETPESDKESESALERIKKFETMYIKQQNENYNLTRAIKKIQDENNILKSSMNREMLLQEQLSSMEKDLSSAKVAAQAKNDLENEKTILQSQLDSWTSAATKIDAEITTPYRLETFVRQLQNSLFEFKNDNVLQKLSSDTFKKDISKANSEIQDLRTRLNALESEKSKIETELKRNTKRLSLLTKDRDSLKGLKESYEQEFEGVISPQLQQRITELENIVANYEEMISGNQENNCQTCEVNKGIILELQAELEKAREASSSTSVGGSFRPPASKESAEDDMEGVKVVTFGSNPSALSLEKRVQLLMSENEKLTQQLRQIQDETINLIPSEEKSKLEEQLKALTRKHEILTEDYNYETEQLQIVITKIFGYHFTLIKEPTSQIRLQSIYTENPDDAFVFQEADNNDMMLLDTPVLEHFREDIQRFLLEEGSIPAFISAVTMTFNQSSVGRSGETTTNTLPSSQTSSSLSGSSQSRGHFLERQQNTVPIEIIPSSRSRQQPQRTPQVHDVVDLGDDDDEDEDDDNMGEPEEGEEEEGEEEQEEAPEEEDDDDDDDVDDMTRRRRMRRDYSDEEEDEDEQEPYDEDEEDCEEEEEVVTIDDD